MQKFMNLLAADVSIGVGRFLKNCHIKNKYRGINQWVFRLCRNKATGVESANREEA